MTAPTLANQTLGTLELELLLLLWTKGPLGSRAACDALNALNTDHRRAPTTVQTTLERMHEKGLLTRELWHGAPYRAAVDRAELLAQLIRRMCQDLGASAADRAAACAALQAVEDTRAAN
jgi:predicted transcriptional regulator